MDTRCEINVTPLVDVVLVLLIIFMVVTPLMNHGYVTSPAKLDHAKVVGEYTLIVQTEPEVVLLNGDTVPVTDLKDRLHALLPATDSSVVYSGADHLVYRVVAQTLDVINDSGADRISITTETKE